MRLPRGLGGANDDHVAERFEPWGLYRLVPTGQRVTVVSFGTHDDGSITLTVNVSSEFNFATADRDVFGINPNDLVPCELPEPSERCGSIRTNIPGLLR